MRTDNKKRIWTDEKGQGMTEYIIIVALIAIASITIVGFFGSQIKGLFAGAGGKLSGTVAADQDTNQATNKNFDQADVDKTGF